MKSLAINYEKLKDAFSQLFGPAGILLIRRFEGDIKNRNTNEVKDKILNRLIFSLRDVSDKLVLVKEDFIPVTERGNDGIWNYFDQNPASYGLALCLITIAEDIDLKTKSMPYSARQLVEQSIPLYIAFVNYSLCNFPENYEKMMDDDLKKYSQEIRKTKLNKLVKSAREKLRKGIDSEEQKEAVSGISNLLGALMYVRERRVEEKPLTLDLKLGLYGNWELIPTASSSISESEESKAEKNDESIKDIKAQINVSFTKIAKLDSISLDMLTKKFEEKANIFGRGVAVMTLDDDVEKIFRIEKIWPDHSGAPLSKLYSFDYEVPNFEDFQNNELHLILLPSGVISFQIYGDPLLEYFAGSWRYIDLAQKIKILARNIYQDKQENDYDEDLLFYSIYRISRIAYQLAYHNHGASIVIDFTKTSIPAGKKLVQASKMLLNSEQNWNKIPRNQEDYDEQASEKIGRWAYQLMTRDGITTFSIDTSGEIFLIEYGKIVTVDSDIVENGWESIQAKMDIAKEDINLGGARHRSALYTAINKDSNEPRLVFCISQDGYIDIYTKEGWMKIR